MLDFIYQKIGAALVTVAVAIFGVQAPTDTLDVTLGATNQIPNTVAVFETSLQNSISSTDSAMTLVAATYNNGASTLASSTYAFVIDGGSSSEEFVTADCTATACTNMTRGLDHLTGTSTVSALRKAHRRGASVKIVTGPILLIHNRLLQGIDGFKTALRYDTSLATSTIDDSRDNLVNVGLLQDTAINAAGIMGASETAAGIVEIATQVEAASSTSSGTIGRLALPASMATSTYNSGTAALRIPITQNSGKIDPNFIDFSNLSGQQLTIGTTTIAGSLTLTGGNSTSNIASSSISAFTASTSPTTTWTKPSNLKYILVKVVGAGGGGGAKQNSGTNDSAGGGGGAGGYCEKIIPADALSATVNVVVPAGGAGGTGAGGDGATNAVPASFGSFCTATNGNAGQGGASQGSGGTAGVGSGGDINLTGGGGSGSGGSTNMSGGAGGNSVMGGGGAGTDGDGNTSGACGGGGGGGGGSSGSDQPGGAGAAGCVYVYQYFF